MKQRLRRLILKVLSAIMPREIREKAYLEVAREVVPEAKEKGVPDEKIREAFLLIAEDMKLK